VRQKFGSSCTRLESERGMRCVQVKKYYLPLQKLSWQTGNTGMRSDPGTWKLLELNEDQLGECTLSTSLLYYSR
jgi:hypothetical protein